MTSLDTPKTGRRLFRCIPEFVRPCQSVRKQWYWVRTRDKVSHGPIPIPLGYRGHDKEDAESAKISDARAHGRMLEGRMARQQEHLDLLEATDTAESPSYGPGIDAIMPEEKQADDSEEKSPNYTTQATGRPIIAFYRGQKTARWWSVCSKQCTVCTFNACPSEKAFSVVPGTPELERQ
ncbi:hypothetical protein TNCV_579451 [Trichonephila clavipes]|nr:hypothetical protein TNCV_579451 [Trichonephila clavipes]